MWAAREPLMSLRGCASHSWEECDRLAMSDTVLMQVATRRAQVGAHDFLAATFFSSKFQPILVPLYIE